MNVDPKHHRYFVARRGQVLRDIADEYGGVMVSFPRSGANSDKVTLKGAKDCVEAAKKRMLEIIEDLVSSHGFTNLFRTDFSHWRLTSVFYLGVLPKRAVLLTPLPRPSSSVSQGHGLRGPALNRGQNLTTGTFQLAFTLELLYLDFLFRVTVQYKEIGQLK